MRPWVYAAAGLAGAVTGGAAGAGVGWLLGGAMGLAKGAGAMGVCGAFLGLTLTERTADRRAAENASSTHRPMGMVMFWLVNGLTATGALVGVLIPMPSASLELALGVLCALGGTGAGVVSGELHRVTVAMPATEGPAASARGSTAGDRIVASLAVVTLGGVCVIGAFYLAKLRDDPGPVQLDVPGRWDVADPAKRFQMGLEPLGKDDVALLLDKLTRGEGMDSIRAEALLRKAGPRCFLASEMLLTAVGDPRPKVNSVAAAALWGVHPPKAVQTLIGQDKGLRARMLVALLTAGGDAAAQELYDALQWVSPEKKIRAARALRLLQKSAPNAEALVTRALVSKDAQVRAAMARAIAEVEGTGSGPDTQPATMPARP